MKKIRNPNEDLEEMLSELKVGDIPIFDTVTNFEISKVPSGFIYMHEYVGAVFVPDAEPKKVPAPKQTMESKKVEKPAPAKKVVTK